MSFTTFPNDIWDAVSILKFHFVNFLLMFIIDLQYYDSA